VTTHASGTPIERLLAALDALDLEAVLALLAPDCALLLADGDRAQGTDAVRAELSDLFEHLHSMTHRLTNQWHVDDVWIAEVEADYDMHDRSRVLRLPRALVARADHAGIAELRIYGAHEHAIYDHEQSDGSVVIGGRYMPSM